MPVTLTKILSNTSTVEVAWGEDMITLEYYPSRVTEKTIADLRSLSESNDSASVVAGFDKLNGVLVTLIKSWDIYDGEQPLEISKEALAELPMFLRAQMAKAIMGDFRPEA